MVDQELQIKWIEALESGQFAQGNGSLRQGRCGEETSDFTYCCLGVAAVTCFPDKIIYNEAGIMGIKNTDPYRDNGELGIKTGSLTYDMEKTLGITEISNHLMMMNDSTFTEEACARESLGDIVSHSTFPEIAAYLREYLELPS